MKKLGLGRTLIGIYFLLTCLTASLATAASGVYPVESEKGIQSISYTITGADSTSYIDGRLESDSIIVRNYQGVLSTGTLRINGTVTTAPSMRSAKLKVSIYLGDSAAGHKSYQVDLERVSQNNFDVSVPIPSVLTPDIRTSGANFSIIVESTYYDDNYGWNTYGEIQITGHLDAPAAAPGNHPPTVSLSLSPAQPIVGSPINFIATAADADGDTLSYAWYLDGALQGGATTNTVNWSQPSIGAHTLKVVVSDGKGGEAEDSVSFTVTNPGAAPYVIAPGFQEVNDEPWGFVDKVFINGEEVSGVSQTRLFTGSRVKTGPGVEILIRSACGAVTRIKENTTYDVEVRKLMRTPTKVVYGHLREGLGDFYWPPGYTGAEKFEVDTSRIVVGIKGTRFTVSHINDVSRVAVQDGEVKVTNLDTSVVSQVKAGNSLTAADTGGYVNGSYNYYVPYYSSSNGSWTGLGLANNNPTTAALTQITVYDQQGNRLDESKKLIAAAGQEAMPVAGGQNAVGWMLVNAHQPLSGLAFVGLNSPQVLMADIPFVNELATELVIPHVAQDATWDTSILICNPQNQPNDIYLELVDQSGFSQGFESLSLPALGSGEYRLATLFPGATRKKGKVIVTASAGVAAFALYSDLKSGGSDYAGINAVTEAPDLRLATAVSSYYLPFFSSENGNWVGLGLASSDIFGTTNTRVTVYNEAGTVQAGSSITVPIWGQVAFSVSPPTISRGWIQIDADGPLNGLAFIGTGGASSLMADIPFVEKLSRKLVVPHVAQDAAWDTTLLLCNPALLPASVQIVNLNLIGEIGGAVNRIIPALGSASYKLSDLFAGGAGVDGKIEITSENGLAGFALYSNVKTGGHYFAGINAEAVE